MDENKNDKITVIESVETGSQSSEVATKDHEHNEISEVESDKTKVLEEIRNDAGKKIQAGLDKKTASTGTPINELNGAAKFTSRLSNIGGGSKEIGGGGMEEGFKTIAKYVDANARLQTMQRDQNTKKDENLNLPQ